LFFVMEERTKPFSGCSGGFAAQGEREARRAGDGEGKAWALLSKAFPQWKRSSSVLPSSGERRGQAAQRIGRMQGGTTADKSSVHHFVNLKNPIAKSGRIFRFSMKYEFPFVHATSCGWRESWPRACFHPAAKEIHHETFSSAVSTSFAWYLHP
jgi:hypothetical protein